MRRENKIVHEKNTIFSVIFIFHPLFAHLIFTISIMKAIIKAKQAKMDVMGVAFSSPPRVGKGVGDGCGDNAGVGDDAIPPSSLIPRVPSLTETGISLIEVSFNVMTSSFKIVEVPGLPTA